MITRIHQILFFLFLLFSNYLSAQKERIDSLIITNSEAKIKVSRSYGIGYVSSNYYLSNDTCYLDVCYYDGTSPTDTYDSTAIPITLPSSPGNYVFKLVTSLTHSVGFLMILSDSILLLLTFRCL